MDLSLQATAARSDLLIEIGGFPVRIHSGDSRLRGLLRHRYSGFLQNPSQEALFEFDIVLTDDATASQADDEVSVSLDSGRWSIDRGDFHAEWDIAFRRGSIRQTANPYSVDSVLRILHTLLLAAQGGFLAHASSAVRNGRAFLFAGISGAGKTTMARLAPPDAILLTDEISYVRRQGDGYVAFGTPFTGELGTPGENISAPIVALYLLAQGPQNKIEPLPPGEALRLLLQNILFFARDLPLANAVFAGACEFTARVPAARLTFVPDARVWEMIQ